MDARSLPEALRKIMERRGWTQTELARELGMSQTWVSQVVRKQKDPGIAKTIRLLGRIELEVHISAKWEETGPVERREFIAAAASVLFIPAGSTSPYQDRAYLETLIGSLARNRYSVGGIPLAPSALAHVARAQKALADVKNGTLLATASELMAQITLILYDADSLTHAERVGAPLFGRLR
jgi:transcriptional regulator with XRE-family HTH domain